MLATLRAAAPAAMYMQRQAASAQRGFLSVRAMAEPAKPAARAPAKPTPKITKADLRDIVREKTNMTVAETDKALNAVLDAIVDGVAGGSEVVIPGFGAFKPRARAARNGRNPKTGEALKIAARVSPAFVAGKTFREAVAKGGAASK